jgi:hypothetical protein
VELDSRGIAQIIQACAKGGVSHIKFHALEISFFEKPCTIMEEKQEIIGQPSPSVEYKPVSAEDELRIKEMHAEELLISDPLAYENHALGEDDSD